LFNLRNKLKVRSINHPLEIFFDAKRLFYNSTGLGNYARWLIKSYHEHHPEDSINLLKPGYKFSPWQVEFELNGIKRIEYPNPLGIKRIFGLGEYIPPGKIFHGLSGEIPYFKNKRAIKALVTIHDVIFHNRKKRLFSNRSKYLPSQNQICGPPLFSYHCDKSKNQIRVNQMVQC
jgi:hypothetical protein